MEHLKEEKQPSKLWSALKWIISLVFFGPSLKVIRQNHELKRMVQIDKTSPENSKKDSTVSPETVWLKKQIKYNYIVALILALPLAYSFYKGTTYIENDHYLSQRLAKVEQENSRLGIIDSVANYYHVLVEHPRDSYEIKVQKYETRVRITAFFIMFTLMMGLHIMGNFIANHHPIIEDSKKVRDLLVNRGIYRREDAEKLLVFATPVGFLLDTSGNSPGEIERATPIWDALNIKIKGFQPDPKRRSIVFFKKAYELQTSYMYDRIETKKENKK